MLLCWAGVIKKLNKKEQKEQIYSIKKLYLWYEINRQMLIPKPMAFGVDETNGHSNEKYYGS